jgi:hypothetical protein
MIVSHTDQILRPRLHQCFKETAINCGSWIMDQWPTHDHAMIQSGPHALGSRDPINPPEEERATTNLRRPQYIQWPAVILTLDLILAFHLSLTSRATLIIPDGRR